jgi:hypothetical protein
VQSLISTSQSAVSIAKQIDGYACAVNLVETVVPSGNTTIKNGFSGLGLTDCPALSPFTENSSLPVPVRIKLPAELLCRIFEIATTIMATITIRDKRIKTILS